jgi:hypothetical protein
MPYSAEISRDNPTAFLFVIDQSGSMDEKMGVGKSKAQFVADVLNRTLYTLTLNCSKASDDPAKGVRHYFDVGVIAYGGSDAKSGFGGALQRSIIHSITDIGNSPLRVEDRIKKIDDGAGGLVDSRTKFPIWFDPLSSGGTPMCAGLTKAAETIAEWCDKHPNSYPPTILHVTDGQSTDGEPETVATAAKQLSTNDGACLLFNLHVSSTGESKVAFPNVEDKAHDEYSRLLYRMSSVLPEHLVKLAGDKGFTISQGARGFIFNGDAEAIVDFFEIGTRPRLMADR